MSVENVRGMKTLDEMLGAAIRNNDVNNYVKFPARHPAREIPGLNWQDESGSSFAACKDGPAIGNNIVALVVRHDGVVHVSMQRTEDKHLPILVVDSEAEAMDVISNMWLMGR